MTNLATKYRTRFAILLLAVSLVAAAGRPAQSAPVDNLQAIREEVICRTEAYMHQLSTLLSLEVESRRRAEEGARKRQALFAQGLISRRELTESEARVQEADRRIEQALQQIIDSERTIEEVKLALEEEAKPRDDGSNIIRFTGKTAWSLTAMPLIEEFYENLFGQILPISAYGQTPLHNHFGLAHQNAIDVALHPDSPEGKALIEYLRESGTPFIAFRAAVPGSATGAHIHIGPPSQRIHVAT
jgi:hypothetical protein